jgi:hypothetical protein
LLFNFLQAENKSEPTPRLPVSVEDAISEEDEGSSSSDERPPEPKQFKSPENIKKNMETTHNNLYGWKIMMIFKKLVDIMSTMKQ